MLRSLILCIVVVGACTGQSQRHQLTMPRTGELASEDTGELSIVFSRKAQNVVVAVNGILVIEGATAKQVDIEEVETGYSTISIAADGVERSTKVWIDSNKTTAMPVGNAGVPQSMNPVVSTALSVVAFLLSRAASDYLF